MPPLVAECVGVDECRTDETVVEADIAVDTGISLSANSVVLGGFAPVETPKAPAPCSWIGLLSLLDIITARNNTK